MAVAEGLSTRCFSRILWNSLIHGVKWLKRALEVISAPCKFKRCKLSDVEEVLAECQVFKLHMLVLCSAFGSSRIKQCRTYSQIFLLAGN